MLTPAPTPAAGPAPRGRRRAWRALQWLVTLGAFAFLLLRQPLSELRQAAERIPLGALGGALALLCLTVVVATLRWGLLLRAFGATRIPGPLTLLYYNWLGFFYNTYLPGGVGGDVVRGIAVRDAFGERGTAHGLSVVFMERVLGLSGLLVLVSLAYLAYPIADLELPLYLAALGPLGAALAVAAIVFGRRLGTRLPGRVGVWFDLLPELRKPAPLVAACLLSLLIHTLIALAGHALVAAVSGVPSLWQSLVVVPLSAAAVYIPVSVGGLGVRDAAFVTLYEWLGVPRAAALAAALSMLVCTFAGAGIGGLWQLWRR